MEYNIFNEEDLKLMNQQMPRMEQSPAVDYAQPTEDFSREGGGVHNSTAKLPE